MTPDSGATDNPFPFPFKTDPMVPPGTMEWRDGSRLLYRYNLRVMHPEAFIYRTTVPIPSRVDDLWAAFRTWYLARSGVA